VPGNGHYLYSQGDLDRAIPPLERALGLSRAGIVLYVPWAATHLGLTYALSGRLTEALPLLEEAAEYRNDAYHSFSTRALAEGYFLAGRTEGAVPLAQRALTDTRERGERGQEAWSLRLLGEIYSHGHAQDVERARSSYDEARDIAGTLGMRPLIAHCHLGLGKLYCGAGDGVKAREHLTIAARMYREMDMRFWLEKAEAELVPPHRNSA
jgi:tetratricopeptide (TPR) repeat protein